MEKELGFALEKIKKASLDDLAFLFKILADKTVVHRKKNDGAVPYTIFPHCITIGGSYPTVEIIVRVHKKDKTYIALRKREKGEQGYEGVYHIPGSIIRLGDKNLSISIKRTLREIFKDLKDIKWQKRLIPINNNFSLLFSTIDKKREATYFSILFQIDIDEKEMKEFRGEWKLFEPQSLKGAPIFKNHIKLLQKIYKK